MALAGVGVDMLEIARMERAMERRPGLVERAFTEEERLYCESSNRPSAHFAARIAAREAVLKALGCGFCGGVHIDDVSVSRNAQGRPVVVLKGRAAEVAREQGVREVAISLSFTHDLAVANAVAVTDEARPKKTTELDQKAQLAATFREARSLVDELERVAQE